jgi:NADPH:quinone reductase-like Zn-dependent oxidoreductase
MGESTVESGIPSVMMAVQQNSYGTTRDALTLRSDVAVPRKLSGSQILVRAYAASMNPINWKILEGHFASVIRLSFPCIPGGDVAGIIVDVGPSVKRLRIGDKVLGMVELKTDGSFAEYVLGEESNFGLKSNNINMLEAPGIASSCQTSYQVLFKKAFPPIGSGSKVFICGGSSATGLYAIQMAKAVGAHVATTCSQRNFSLMEKLGLFS